MNENRRNVKAAVCILVACVVCGILIMAAVLPGRNRPAEDPVYDQASDPVHDPVQPARILFAGTKDDADCAILRSQNACVVIDTGEEQDAEHILALLQQERVEAIDCLILTHPDQDHIGGAPTLLESLPVGTILAPDYDQSKDRYDALMKQAEELDVNIMIPKDREELQYGELSLCVWPPEKTHYDKDNNYSLAVLASHGDVKMFFAGDAQKKRMKELLQYDLPQVDLYKVSYHGRDLTTGVRLIEAIRPQYAVVTAAAPGPEMEQALLSAGAEIFCTREQDVIFVSDGKELCLDLVADLYSLCHD